jgi:hypothetical protein
MPQPASSPAVGGIPRGLALLISVPILFHLIAVVFQVLSASSGPWPLPDGGSNSWFPPQFALTVSNRFNTSGKKTGYGTADYLSLVKLDHDYHFVSNRPRQSAVYFEARLKDKQGNEVATVRCPDPNAICFVRHRQAILARRLAEDVPLPPAQSELVPAPGQEMPKVLMWEPTGPRTGVLREVKQNLVPREQPHQRPSDLSLALARSYARYLCRTHGADSIELVRHISDPIHPGVMFMMDDQPEQFDELISNFGDPR